MALYSVKPLYSASATVTNGSDIVQVTGNVNCSFLQSGAIVSISGSNRLVDAVSGTGIDGSGNSTIKLRRPWPGATITGQMLVFMSYEGLADAVFQLKSLIDAAAAEVEGAFSFKGDYDLAAAGTLPTNPAEGAGSEMWRISTTATVGSVLYRAGDLIFYDQYLTVWRKVAENLGTAAYLNKGNGTADLPDNAQLNLRLGTSDNLGNAAQRNVMTSPTDIATPDALMPRGAFGVGSNAPSLNEAALNALRQSGFFRTTATAFSPFSALLHLAYSVDNPNFGLQLAAVMGVDFPQLKARVLNNGVWGGSVDLYTNRNIVGSVNQSSGIPTGAIVETGSNAGGRYVRFADGTQICTRFLNVPLSMSLYSSGIYTGLIEVSFAAAFVDNALYVYGSGQDQGATGWCSFNRASATSAILLYYSKTPSVTATALMITAIGRWF
jgi:hypothetical protein